MKAAILVDGLLNRGGVERIVLKQAEILKADIFTGRIDYAATFPEFKNFKVVEIAKGSRGKLNTLYNWFKFSRLKLNYDIYIFHGAASMNAARRHQPNIWYCHSPSRYLYDLHEHEYSYQKGVNRLLYPIVTSFLRRKDQSNVVYITKILVNSDNVKKRVKKYYNRDSEVLYPFVEIKRFRYLAKGNYFLSTGRLDRIKRIDLIIQAFRQLPDKHLVIVSTGPEEAALKKLAGGCSNIRFAGSVSDDELEELYGNSIASLYLSYQEDFGMVPIESMAAGKPCIATNAGGFKETIIHKKTGYLVNNPENVDEVIEAIKWIEKNAPSMRKACEKQAQKFSSEVFVSKFREHLSSVLGKEP